ncbi:MAG TPA: polysaccharide biosynthesis/export family protein, partial [Thermoanaerobaculia bacterium]|nr:polysaccharide biosynthesis/export family protein [Thermoanaerobaculia bacterium]
MTSPRALRRLLALGAAACALSAAAQPAAPADTPAAYRLGPADRVQVKVAETELDLDARLSSGGTLAVPLLGDVPAAGLTAAELAAEIERRLEADYLARATVTVEVLEIQSKTVSVLGAVAKPGSYGVPGGWTLLQAIGAAGGLATDRGNTVRVVRHADNGLTDQITLSLDELVEQAAP